MSYDKEKAESFNLLGGINSKASPYVNGHMEFRDISNLNFRIPGALNKRDGTTLYVGATVSGQITGGVEFERLNGSSFIVVTANTNAYTVTAGGFSAFKTGILSGALTDFVTFVDRLFMCNGQDFIRTDTASTSNYGLPYGSTAGWGATAQVGGSMITGTTGIFVVTYGYYNDRGYAGPVAPGITVTLNGATFNSILYYGMTTPAGFGITSLAFYRSSNLGVDPAGTTYGPASGTTFLDTGFPLTIRTTPPYIYFTLIPRYIEIYNNQLFMAGFSGFPSTAAWSDVGEPEGVDPDFNVEFRTNDGDRLTGMRSYAGSLIITKERSFHRITGADPGDFLVIEVSDQYGCLSNRAMIVFEDRMWFLDTKGIVEYTGANVRIVSNKVEPFFMRMNIAAARDNAWGFHNKLANEVWFAVPVDGSPVNNLIIVYDYLANAWTHYDGVQAANIFLAKGSLAVKSPMFGGYTGQIGYFGASFYGDSGSAITCMIDTSFLAARGQTTEDMYRRFYLNVVPIVGVTQPITVNLKTNYGATIQATRTMYQNPFQSRIDFGLSAKSINAQAIHTSASLPLTIAGYAFESRFQRDT